MNGRIEGIRLGYGFDNLRGFDSLTQAGVEEAVVLQAVSKALPAMRIADDDVNSIFHFIFSFFMYGKHNSAVLNPCNGEVKDLLRLEY